MRSQVEEKLQDALEAVARAQESYDVAVKERRELAETTERECQRLARMRQELCQVPSDDDASSAMLFVYPRGNLEDLRKDYEVLLAEYESKHERLLKVMPGLVACAEEDLRRSREVFGALVYDATGGGRSLLRALEVETAHA